MKENFDAAFDRMLRSEGYMERADNPYGFSNHPSDPGGVTQLGVTKRAWEDYLGKKVTIDDMKALRPETVKPFYKTRYWDRVRGDELPSGVDYAAFDFAVNSGATKSIRTMQDIAGAISDGIMGPKTLAAINRVPANEMIEAITMDRLAFLKRLSTWSVFGKGWENRVLSVEQTSLKMIG